MNMRYFPVMAVTLILSFGAFAQEEKPKGTVMNLVQEMKMGQLSVKLEGKQTFLPPTCFRLEGTVVYPELGMTSKMLAVSDGKVVKQYMETPLGAQAVTVDLQKVQEKYPAYKPSGEHNPLMYKKMIENATDKTALPETEMDGVKVEGYEFPANDLGGATLPESLGGLPTAQPKKYRVWINPDDGLLRKMEVEDANGTVFLSMTFTNVKSGVDIPAETFTYRFPEGTTPMDMTAMVLQGMGGAAMEAPAVTPENP